MANLAMIAVLSLPIIAFMRCWISNYRAAANFRVLATLTTMFLMAFLLFIQHRRLNQELRRTNVVLQEASLTDPLTGLRNRRFFLRRLKGMSARRCALTPMVTTRTLAISCFI